MSIKLAKGENIIRRYDYANVRFKKGRAGSTTQKNKSLVITNRRLIHTTETEGSGNRYFTSEEIPISEAKNVNVSYREKRCPYLRRLGVVFLIFAFLFVGSVFLMGRLLPKIPFVTSDSLVVTVVPLILSGIFLLISVLYFVKYHKKRDYSVTCVIGTENKYFPTVSLVDKNLPAKDNERKAAKKIKLDICINNEVALAMVEEIGAVISCVANGEVDNVPAVSESAEEPETPEAAESAEEPRDDGISQANDYGEASEGPDVSEIHEASEAFEILKVSDVLEASDTTDTADVTDTTEAVEAADTPEATDTTEATAEAETVEETDTAEVTDEVETADSTDTAEVPDEAELK